MTTSVTRPCFTTQHQTCKTKTKTTVCKTKTKTILLVSGWSCPKTDSLRPHHWFLVIFLSLFYFGLCGRLSWLNRQPSRYINIGSSHQITHHTSNHIWPRNGSVSILSTLQPTRSLDHRTHRGLLFKWPISPGTASG